MQAVVLIQPNITYLLLSPSFSLTFLLNILLSIELSVSISCFQPFCIYLLYTKPEDRAPYLNRFFQLRQKWQNSCQHFPAKTKQKQQQKQKKQQKQQQQWRNARAVAMLQLKQWEQLPRYQQPGGNKGSQLTAAERKMSVVNNNAPSCNNKILTH